MGGACGAVSEADGGAGDVKGLSQVVAYIGNQENFRSYAEKQTILLDFYLFQGSLLTNLFAFLFSQVVFPKCNLLRGKCFKECL